MNMKLMCDSYKIEKTENYGYPLPFYANVTEYLWNWTLNPVAKAVVGENLHRLHQFYGFVG